MSWTGGLALVAGITLVGPVVSALLFLWLRGVMRWALPEAFRPRVDEEEERAAEDGRLALAVLALRAERDRAQAEARSLRSQLAVARAEAEALHSRLEDAREEIDGLRATLQRAVRNRNELWDALERSGAEIEALKDAAVASALGSLRAK